MWYVYADPPILPGVCLCYSQNFLTQGLAEGLAAIFTQFNLGSLSVKLLDEDYISKEDSVQYVRKSREYRYKNPTMQFLCPLCGAHRSIKYRPRLSVLNYMQIILISLALIYLCYPVMQLRSFFLFFLVWFGFEGSVRILFKKDLPCPHCGFDASWYKRDVRVARAKVEEFWQKKMDDAKSESESAAHLAKSSEMMEKFDSSVLE